MPRRSRPCAAIGLSGSGGSSGGGGGGGGGAARFWWRPHAHLSVLPPSWRPFISTIAATAAACSQNCTKP